MSKAKWSPIRNINIVEDVDILYLHKKIKISIYQDNRHHLYWLEVCKIKRVGTNAVGKDRDHTSIYNIKEVNMPKITDEINKELKVIKKNNKKTKKQDEIRPKWNYWFINIKYRNGESVNLNGYNLDKNIEELVNKLSHVTKKLVFKLDGRGTLSKKV